MIVTTIAGDRAREPASSMSSTNRGSVLLRRWRKLACRNGIVTIPIRPCHERGTRANWSSDTTSTHEEDDPDRRDEEHHATDLVANPMMMVGA